MNPSAAQPTMSPASEADAVFDVRPIPCRVKHTQIFQRWHELPVGQHFVLLNDHDPIPLFYQFRAEFAEAFAWEYLERGPEDFRVKITKLKALEGRAPAAPESCAPPAAANRAPTVSASAVQEIDVRGLEPPEPLIRILDRLESLPAGATLRARTDREPCHLFGEAVQRGFRHECAELPDGSWLTVLTRA
jgi:uncharacterized protein (DUF2249 family)